VREGCVAFSCFLLRMECDVYILQGVWCCSCGVDGGGCQGLRKVIFVVRV
jgi:hypothetical protein